MSASQNATRRGILDLPNSLSAGLIAATVLNVIHFTIFSLAPVFPLFVPLIGFTQWLYIGPMIAQNWMEGRKECSKGLLIIGVITLIISIVVIIATHWSEETYL